MSLLDGLGEKMNQNELFDIYSQLFEDEFEESGILLEAMTLDPEDTLEIDDVSEEDEEFLDPDLGEDTDDLNFENEYCFESILDLLDDNTAANESDVDIDDDDGDSDNESFEDDSIDLDLAIISDDEDFDDSDFDDEDFDDSDFDDDLD